MRAASSILGALSSPGSSNQVGNIAASTLLGDLDNLGADLDDLQRRVADEEAAALAASRKAGQRNESRNQFSDMGMPASVHAKPAPGVPAARSDAAPVSASTTPRSSVFDLMRQKEGPNLKQQAEAKLAAEAAAMVEFDIKLRAGYQFLSEFFRELNIVNPHFAGTRVLPYFGDCPPMYFSEGIISVRTRRIEQDGKLKDIIDHLPGSYFLISNDKRRVTVNADELPRTKEMLADYEIPYQVTELRDDFKQVRRASVEAQFKFICSFNLRADYPGQLLDLTCRNIGALGRRRYSIPAASLEVSVLEEFSKMLLGYPAPAMDAFAV